MVREGGSWRGPGCRSEGASERVCREEELEEPGKGLRGCGAAMNGTWHLNGAQKEGKVFQELQRRHLGKA